jgi:diketogulonate reductase-like aldo/keto reductase
MHRNVAVIPKAAKTNHMKENIATVEKCILTDDDVEKIKTGINDVARMNGNICRIFGLTCFEGLDGM